MTTSNGYNYTDSNFKCILPMLCDEAGNLYNPYSHPTRLSTENRCMVCSTPEHILIPPAKINSIILPCVIRGTKGQRHQIYGRDRDGSVYQTYLAAAHFKVSLCPDCEDRAWALMATSDHAVEARDDWWDIIDEFAYKLNDPIWDKFSYKKARQALADKVKKTLALLDCAIRQEPKYPALTDIPTDTPTDIPNPTLSPSLGGGTPNGTPINILTILPQDILYPLAQQLIRVEEDRLATKIQALYRGWYQRFWHPSRQWLKAEHKHVFNHKQAQNKNLWTICNDCFTRRAVRDTTMYDACADQDGCCGKVVCSTYCLYTCENPKCRGPIYLHQEDKNHNGDQLIWDCPNCNHPNQIHEEWYGLSISNNIARYE